MPRSGRTGPRGRARSGRRPPPAAQAAAPLAAPAAAVFAGPAAAQAASTASSSTSAPPPTTASTRTQPGATRGSHAANEGPTAHGSSGKALGSEGGEADAHQVATGGAGADDALEPAFHDGHELAYALPVARGLENYLASSTQGHADGPAPAKRPRLARGDLAALPDPRDDFTHEHARHDQHATSHADSMQSSLDQASQQEDLRELDAQGGRSELQQTFSPPPPGGAMGGGFLPGQEFLNEGGPPAEDLEMHADGPDEGQVICRMCGTSTPTYALYLKHLRLEHYHLCEECGRAFTSSKDLVQHMHLEHPAKRLSQHVCAACGKLFSNQSHLNRHIRTIHQQRRDYKCEHCPKSFALPETLHVHVRNVHMSRRDYQCERCEKSFSERKSLTVHLATVHDGHRPFTCSVCEKRFSQRSNLRNHFRTVHQRLAPFKCPACGKRSSHKSNLKSHLRRVHLRTKEEIVALSRAGKLDAADPDRPVGTAAAESSLDQSENVQQDATECDPLQPGVPQHQPHQMLDT